MKVLPRFTAILAGCAMVAAAPAPSAAQDIDTMPVPLVEVSMGYAFQRTSTEDRFPGGWYFSGAGNLSQWFAVVGEASGSYRSEESTGGTLALSDKSQIYTFMGGPRFFHKTGRVVPFGQMLFGVASHRLQQTETRSGEGFGAGTHTWSDSSTAFAMQPGGGITVYLTERVGVRAAGDYRVTIDSNNDAVLHEVRFLTGFTFQWGSR